MQKIIFLLTSIFLAGGCSYHRGKIESEVPGLEFIEISTFGLFIVLSFLVVNYILQLEFERVGYDVRIADYIVLISVIGGFAGSKLFFALEQYSKWSSSGGFLNYLFTGSGLTWYGGFIVAATGIIILFYRKAVPLLKGVDLTAPALAIGYAIGRLGCMVSGDGCYGVACDGIMPFPFCAAFEHGAYPWSEVVARYGNENVKVFNTPLFEALVSFAAFLLLWSLRKKKLPAGMLFFIFVLIHSTARFFVEFIRTNPRDVFGMSQAQFISLVIMGLSLIYFGLVAYKNIYYIKRG